MSLVDLHGVRKSVRTPDGSDLTILRGIDLRIERGEHVAVVGRSGSGKSTLLNLIGLLDTASEGEIVFDGTPTSKLSSVRRDRLRGTSVGFIFQQFNLMQKRTATENVSMPLLYERDQRFWKRRGIAIEMLERVGLGHRLDARPNRLSGGEQQRVAIARALVRRPSLILADEPTGALDVETGVSVMELLDEVSRETGAAVMIITHDPTIAARSERVIRLSEGVIEGEGLEGLGLTEALAERGALSTRSSVRAGAGSPALATAAPDAAAPDAAAPGADPAVTSDVLAEPVTAPVSLPPAAPDGTQSEASPVEEHHIDAGLFGAAEPDRTPGGPRETPADGWARPVEPRSTPAEPIESIEPIVLEQQETVHASGRAGSGSERASEAWDGDGSELTRRRRRSGPRTWLARRRGGSEDGA